MMKSNVLNFLGILAALALSSLFLMRVTAFPSPETQPANAVAAKAAAPATIVISSYPADAVVIEASSGK